MPMSKREEWAAENCVQLPPDDYNEQGASVMFPKMTWYRVWYAAMFHRVHALSLNEELFWKSAADYAWQQGS